jgi:FkbM family methyltransferase
MGISHISYIDIGANDPSYSNNTYLFYTQNSQGVLIEADTTFIDRLENKRPRDLVINAAISTKDDGEADFYIFKDTALNTLSKDDVELRTRSGLNPVVEIRKIKLFTIASIIDNYLNKQLPHLISLDVEGMDYDILESFDFKKYPVPVWIVETCAYSENHIKPKVTAIIDLMLQNGYFIFADTYINTIFVHKKWFQTK